MAETQAVNPPIKQPNNKYKLGRIEKRNLISGLIFLSPWLIGFAVFMLYPMVASLIYSFSDFQGIHSSQVTWYANYAAIFNDPRFWKSLLNTGFLVVISVPLSLLISFFSRCTAQLESKGPIHLSGGLFPAIHCSHNCQYYVMDLDIKVRYGIFSTVLGWFHLESPNWFLNPLWASEGVESHFNIGSRHEQHTRNDSFPVDGR